MRYEEIVSYIDGIPKFTEKHSLAHTRRFLEVLGNPDREYASVHVAGTNGKGSVCAFLSSICREAGVSCGMFTSPHLSDMRERMQIDGEMISEEAFAEAFFRVRGAAEALAEEGLSHPSYFEFLYLMACCFFAKARPEVVLVETGLGGRLDATNTLERPLVTVITSVSLDHMQYLGTTVPEIAFEKAGILKPGVPAVAWCEDPEAAQVIEKRAREVGAPLFRVTREDIRIPEEEGEILRRCAPWNDKAGQSVKETGAAEEILRRCASQNDRAGQSGKETGAEEEILRRCASQNDRAGQSGKETGAAEEILCRCASQNDKAGQSVKETGAAEEILRRCASQNDRAGQSGKETGAEEEILRRCALWNDKNGNTEGVSLRAENGEVFLNRASGIDFFVRSGYDSRQIRLWVPGAALFQTENAALAVRTAEVLERKALLFAGYILLAEEKSFTEKTANAAQPSSMDKSDGYLPLTGNPDEYKGENCALVGRNHFDELLRAGIGRMRWPCRMEEILPDVYLDGAHNEDGIRRFAESMERLLESENGEGVSLSGAKMNSSESACPEGVTLPDRDAKSCGNAEKTRRGGRRRFVLLFGAVNDKDYGAMIRRLAALKPALVIATEVPGSRKAAAEEFAEAFAENGVKNVTVIKTAEEAFARALEEKKDGVAGICGSLYLAGEIRGFL